MTERNDKQEPGSANPQGQQSQDQGRQGQMDQGQQRQQDSGTGGQDGSQTGASGLGDGDQQRGGNPDGVQQEQADYGSIRDGQTGQDREPRQTDTGIGEDNDAEADEAGFNGA